MKIKKHDTSSKNPTLFPTLYKKWCGDFATVLYYNKSIKSS